MVSTTDVESGVVMVDAVVPAVVITSVDISKIPVELTEDVSAEVKPWVMLSTEVVSRVVASAELVPRVVLSTEVVPRVVVSAEELPSVVISGSKYTFVVPALDVNIVDVSNSTPVELTEGVISADVVPIVVLSTEMVPGLAVSAKVLDTAVISVVSAEVVV